MNVEELLHKETIDDITDFILILRKLGYDNDQIHQSLISRFDKKISSEELKQLIKQAK